ncbi:MAG: site-specific DNA-methyltransferase [Desulfovibrio sp.]|nr:site-specific DNA-methyltransferase [Desulfovibrio sp.]
MQWLVNLVADKDSIILDSFAGSGTTGRAVLKQNAEDGVNRRFILIEWTKI